MGKNNYRIGRIASGKCLLCAEPVSILTKTAGIEAWVCEECASYAAALEKNKADLKGHFIIENLESDDKPRISFRDIKRNLSRSWEQKMEQFYFNAG